MTDDVHTRSGAYALHALPEDERAEFEQHLDQCHSCRADVREFLAVGAELAELVAEEPPSGLRAAVLAATVDEPAAATVQWAIGELLGAESRREVVDVVRSVVDRLGGEVVRAEDAGPDAIPLDVGLETGAPLLPVAARGTQARADLERHLPQLIEDAREVLESLLRSRDASDHAAARDSDDPGR